MPKNLVCYLFTKFDNKKKLFEFIRYYKKYQIFSNIDIKSSLRNFIYIYKEFLED